jgi:predicted nucleic acid-binding protein
MIYLDTAFCIYLVEHPGARGDHARLEINTDQEYAISPLVLMECLVKPLRHSNTALEDAYRATLNEFRLLVIGTEAYERAARLRAATGVRMPDAIHWATAALNNCVEVWTGDSSFSAKSAGYAVDKFAGLP